MNDARSSLSEWWKRVPARRELAVSSLAIVPLSLYWYIREREFLFFLPLSTFRVVVELAMTAFLAGVASVCMWRAFIRYRTCQMYPDRIGRWLFGAGAVCMTSGFLIVIAKLVWLVSE